MEPKFVKKNDPTGANSGDHTHLLPAVSLTVLGWAIA
jgi:hypothetical protein